MSRVRAAVYLPISNSTISDTIPVVTSLDDIYTQSSLLAQGKRWDELVQGFERQYGHKPDFVARAPGRVNVIGEHIDYAGFSVLPAAIERDVLMACSCSERAPSSHDASQHRVVLSNVRPKYAQHEFEFDGSRGAKDIKIDSSKLEWSNYFKAGVTGTLGLPSYSSVKEGRDIKVLVDGNVPAGGGLSSSAAMTTCSAVLASVAFAPADGPSESVTRKQLTEVAIESERLVGVNSGGMDQTASVFGQRSHLLHIDFVPSLNATPIRLPSTNPAVSFVVANTLVTADKHTTSKFNYNLRVVETRVGAQILARHLGLDLPAEPPASFKNVTDAYFDKKGGSASAEGADVARENVQRLEQMLEIVKKVFANGDETDVKGVEWEEVSRLLGGMSREAYLERFEKGFEVEAPGGRLKLYKRARHVFAEAARVYKFRSLLESASSSPSLDLVEQLGGLMDESQASCRDDYECSCPEIDDMVKIAKESGSFGSRLSGAGWGGCTVHLVRTDDEAHFISQLKEKYYRKVFGAKLSEDELNQAVLATRPEAGACIYKVEA